MVESLASMGNLARHKVLAISIGTLRLVIELREFIEKNCEETYLIFENYLVYAACFHIYCTTWQI